VALSGWLSTFLSTALALHWRAMGLPLHEHFQALAALALVCFLVILVSALVRAWRATSTP
jgi:predicted membrane metal-binding protein